MFDASAAAPGPAPLARQTPAPRLWRTVTLIITTRRRPHGLMRVARAAFAQRGAGLALDVVAVDADPGGSALSLMRTLEGEAPVPFTWTHAPCPDSIAPARAAGLAKATGDLVAFLDDRHEPEPGWLAALAAALRAANADAAFGAIAPRLPAGLLLARGLITALHARTAPAAPGPEADLLDLSGALFVRTRIFPGRAPFAGGAALGAEADAVLARAQAAGASFVWAQGARLETHVPSDEARLSAAAARALGEGARRRLALAAAGADPETLRSMRLRAAVGVLALAPVTALAWLLLWRRSDELLAQMCRNAGLAFAAGPLPRQAQGPAPRARSGHRLWPAATGARRLARVPAL